MLVLMQVNSDGHEDKDSAGRESVEGVDHGKTFLNAGKIGMRKKRSKRTKNKIIKHSKLTGKVNVKEIGGKSPGTRQFDEKCFNTMIARTKKFNTYETQLRKAKRIKTLVSKLDTKKGKALTVFKDAANIIRIATFNGTRCENRPLAKTDQPRIIFEKLQNCTPTASEICESKNIEGLNITTINTIESCINSLGIYIKAFKVRLIFKAYILYWVFMRLGVFLS